MKLNVEMYGLSPFTDTNEVDVEVKEDAGLPDLIAALVKKIPSFKGRVIQAGDSRLVETYGMYVNGRFVDQDERLQLKPDDRVVLILLATGG
jgi:hypothetical protein